MVVGRTVDLLANRKLRHREPLLELSMPNVERFVEAWVNLGGRSKPGSRRKWNLSIAPDRAPGATKLPSVRQSKVFVNPGSIAHVDMAAAERTFPEVLRFAQSWPGDLFAHACAARKWIFQARDFHLDHLKKIRLGLLRARSLYDRAAIKFYCQDDRRCRASLVPDR
jgi:hypothetical protein